VTLLKRKEAAPPEPEKRSRIRIKRREPEPPPEPEKKRPGKRTAALAIAGLAGAVMFWKKRGSGDDGADRDD
jgi:hypothetical protein